MKKRTKLAAGAGAAIAVVGAGGAIAATKLSPEAESKAVVEDAAKQLGVTPAKLRAALEQAVENRIDQAVKDGRLTAEQAEAMKQRLESGDFPLFGGPMFGGKGLHHHLHVGIEAAASYLGVTEAELRQQLRDGKTLAEVAKAEGKSVDGLVDAIVAAEKKELDEAVAAGKLTKAQRDAIVAKLEQATTAIVNGARPAFEGRRGFGFRGHGPGAGPGEFRGGPGIPPPGDA